jgi:hypothetical protein
MTLIVILFCLMLATLLALSVINRMQEIQRQRRLQQRRLRIQAEELIELITSLEQTIPNRMIIKHINDTVISLQQQMLELEDANPDHIETAIRKSELYSEELLDSKSKKATSYQRESDAQIAKTQLHLHEAMHLVTQLAAQGTITDEEMSSYLSELRWAHLMVSVMSYIGQGDKSMSISDRFSAQAFYRKAQQLLMESMHQDPRRLRMIKELGEIIGEERTELSRDLRDSTPGALAITEESEL